MRAEDETDTILDTAEGQAMSRLLNSQEWARRNVLSRAGLIKRLEMMRDRHCEIECSPGSIGTWLGMNVCLCGQCCGFLPWARTRNVQPGKKRGMGRLAMVIPASPAGAPQPAEMARGPGDAVQLLG